MTIKVLKDYEYFKTDNGILYCGDCNEILPLLEKESIDLVVTSPPYNVAINYDNYNDNILEEEYFKFTKGWIDGLKDIVKVGGRLGINIPIIGNSIKISKSEKYVFYLDKYINIIEKNYTLREIITWIKSHSDKDENGSCAELGSAWGSWKSPSNPFCRSMSEFIIIAHKELPKIQHSGETDLTKEEFTAWARNVWFMPTQKSKEHPAVFNEQLPYRLIKFYTYIGDTILDPFMGSGTTALVAEKLKRKWIGVEQSPKYCQGIKNRVEYFSNQIKMF